MKHYYVDLNCGMAIVKARLIKKVEKFSNSYFGTLHVRLVRLAQAEEVNWYEAMGGIIHEADNVPV